MRRVSGPLPAQVGLDNNIRPKLADGQVVERDNATERVDGFDSADEARGEGENEPVGEAFFKKGLDDSRAAFYHQGFDSEFAEQIQQGVEVNAAAWRGGQTEDFCAEGFDFRLTFGIGFSDGDPQGVDGMFQKIGGERNPKVTIEDDGSRVGAGGESNRQPGIIHQNRADADENRVVRGAQFVSHFHGFGAAEFEALAGEGDTAVERLGVGEGDAGTHGNDERHRTCVLVQV